MGREKSKHTNSQNEMILKYLECHGSITQIDAVRVYGCYRLSARIFDLREMGHDIKTVRCVTKNENGNTVQYAKYVLRKEG